MGRGGYKAVLFDAYATLWHPELSGAGTWHKMMAEFGHEISLESVQEAYAMALQEEFMARLDAFETSGVTNEPDAINSFWRDLNIRILRAVEITDGQESLADRINDWFARFGIPHSLYPEVAEVMGRVMIFIFHIFPSVSCLVNGMLWLRFRSVWLMHYTCL